MLSPEITLVNFRCPEPLKAEIDRICRARNISRTSLLVRFLEDVVDEWKPRIEQAYERPKWPLRKPARSMDDYWGLPMPILPGSEDLDDWK